MGERELRRSGKPSQPVAPKGVPATGRVAKLMIGQGHGVIRSRHDRDVFFHRADVAEGTAFNDLRIGDVVVFEQLDDQFSGARALQVRRGSKKPQRRKTGVSL